MDVQRMSRRCSAGVPLVVAVLALAACGGAEVADTAHQPSTTAVKAVGTPDPATCVVEAANWPDGKAPSPAEQASKRQVIDEVLTPTFGSGSSNKGPADQLSKGFLGLAIDRTNRVYVAVVDQTQVDVSRLDEQLRAAAAGTKPPVKFKAQPSCFTAAELREAADVLRAGDWHPRAKAKATRWSLVAEDSTFHVEVSDQAVARALKKRLGDRVTIADD